MNGSKLTNYIPAVGGGLGALIASLVGLGPVGGFVGYGAGSALKSSLNNLLGYTNPSPGEELNKALTGSALSAYGGEFLQSAMNPYINSINNRNQPQLSVNKSIQNNTPTIEEKDPLTFYHGTGSRSADNINKNGFVVTQGGRNKGTGISISSDLASAERFATTKGQEFQKRNDIGGVFKINISPKAKFISSDYYMNIRNNFYDSFKNDGLSNEDAFSKAQKTTIDYIKKLCVDVIDMRGGLASYGNEEELRILNPQIITNYQYIPYTK